MRTLFLTRALLALCGLFCLSASAAPSCWPSTIGGTGGEATYALANKIGPAAGWLCPDGASPLYAVRWGDVTPEMGRAMEALWGASDKQAAAAALLPFATRSATDVFDVWAQFASWKPVVAEGGSVHLNNPAAGAVIRYGADTRWVIKPVYGDIACTNAVFGDPAPLAVKSCQAAMFVGKAIPAPAPVYTHKVKANGVATDRPVYSLSNGIRTLATGRALVGQPCDTTKPTAPSTGSDLWATFGPAFAPGVVALCSKD